MAIWDIVLGPVLDIAKKYVTDKDKQNELAFELEKLREQTEVTLATAQTDINKIEAGSSNLFVAGWRPAIGWVGAIALFTYYVPYCLVATGIWAYQVIHQGILVPRPDLGITDLLGLIGGLLGFGYMRHKERLGGVA